MEKFRALFTRANLIRAAIALFATAIVVLLAFMVSSGKEWATVQQGQDRAYLVKVADSALEHARGLSNTTPQQLGEAVGMLFVFEDQDVRDFWMNDMRYALDVLWIKDGKVVKIDYGVPAQELGAKPESMTSEPFLVDMVLEVPAGVAYQLGYVEGVNLTIDFTPGEDEESGE